MARRRTIAICQEGYYYLFVLSFIIGGALLRQVNLLIILAGIMIGLLVFNWRFVTTSLTQLRVRRKLPPYICAGDPFQIGLVVDNDRRWLDSWALVLDDVVREQSPDKTGGDSQVSRPKVMIPHVATQNESWGDYRCVFHRRGRYQFGPITVSTRFPLGLVVGARRYEISDGLIVYPKLGHLTPSWRHAIESMASGDQRAQARRGVVEGDHYGLRDWRAGDNRRWIHWRASAKLNELKVREFESHHNHELALMLDLWTPPSEVDRTTDLVEFAVEFAATVVVDSCHRGARRMTFAATGSQDCYLAGPASIESMHEALEHLATIEANVANQMPAMLSQLAKETSGGTRIVVISTRPADMTTLARATGMNETELHSLMQRIAWIDVANMDCSNLFEVTAETAE